MCGLSIYTPKPVSVCFFFLPFHSQVLHLAVLVLQQFEQHGHHFPLTVLVQFDAVLLQLQHQVVGGHEPGVTRT